jgi:transcriptional regulator with XRE-family HTH domain
MNIIRELLRKNDIQQKQLAIDIGVSNPTISDWVHNRKDPSGKNLKKLAEYFGVDELVILGSGVSKPQNPLFVPDDPKVSGKSETEQIIERLLKQLDNQPKTPEARILAKGVDKLPPEQREQALAVFRAVFANHSEDFEKGTEHDDT